MSNEIDLNTLKYNELKSLAKEKGLDASGTKEDLLARLNGAGINGGEVEDDTEDGSADETPVTAPAAPKAVNEAVEEKKAEKALRSDAKAMKEALEKQPKVSIMIPFEVGENAEQGKKVPFHVNVNGYKMDLDRGVYIEVPKQIADMIKERLESEGKIGSQWRIDRDANKQSALG